MMPNDPKNETMLAANGSVPATTQPESGVINMNPMHDPLAHQAVQMQTTATQQPAQLAADDAELIEDEWVAIVKKILQDHKNDPYLLSRAMTMLRADYLKKRYNKDIKIPQ